MHGLASVTNRYALLLESAGKQDEALPVIRRRSASRNSLVAEHPEIPQYQHALASIYHNLGVRQQRSGQLSSALASVEKAIELSEGLVRQAPDVPSIVISWPITTKHSLP